jgi:hypothetical protein
MSMTDRRPRRGAAALLIAQLLCAETAFAQPAGAGQAFRGEPRPEDMAADLLIVRPIGVAATAVGAAAFVVSLPFTLLGGNAGDAGRKLVLGPGRETFVRCLGCRKAGWRGDYDPED